MGLGPLRLSPNQSSPLRPSENLQELVDLVADLFDKLQEQVPAARALRRQRLDVPRREYRPVAFLLGSVTLMACLADSTGRIIGQLWTAAAESLTNSCSEGSPPIWPHKGGDDRRWRAGALVAFNCNGSKVCKQAFHDLLDLCRQGPRAHILPLQFFCCWLIGCLVGGG